MSSVPISLSSPDTAPHSLPATLLDFDLDGLAEILSAEGQPAYRARQLFAALHQRFVGDWENVSELPAPLRGRLSERYRLSASELVLEAASTDGTRKRLLRLGDGQEIETVAIPSISPQGHRRISVCVSTQAGCAMACTFCATGQMGFARHLTVGEIVDQVYTFGRGVVPEQRPTHVVFMGMGEPLANYDATLAAVRRLIDSRGAHLSQRRITISTSGLVPEIERLAGEGLELTLAISLHAPNNALRSSLMPINRRYPLGQLIKAAAEYARATGRRVSYEYVLLRGVNDGLTQANELASLLPRRLTHVNLIPYNATDAGYEATEASRVREFLVALQARGVSATVRASRGRDIAAACGQLRAENRRPGAATPATAREPRLRGAGGRARPRPAG
jgi:23S rRNA (adenine2503-C2)-methyltransferase